MGIDKFIETCKKIINNGGSCKDIFCSDCPFGKHNNGLDTSCADAGFSDRVLLAGEIDKILLKSEKKYLEEPNAGNKKIDKDRFTACHKEIVELLINDDCLDETKTIEILKKYFS